MLTERNLNDDNKDDSDEIHTTDLSVVTDDRSLINSDYRLSQA